MRHSPQTLISKFLLSLGLAAQFFVLVPGTGFASQEKSDAPVRAGESDSLQQGLKALQDNRLEEALRYLTAAEGGQPADAQIRNFRGIGVVRLGRNSEAGKEFTGVARS